MNYIEYKLIASDEQTAEILMAMLAEKEFSTFDQNENILNAYISEKDHDADEIALFMKGLREQYTFTWTKNLFEEKNWNTEWEKNFQPILVAEKCLIRAPFHQPQKNIEFDILIEPRMSFGTGHHESTYLMLEEILGLDFTDKMVADAGCGTGILSILAIKKNAKHVLAIDNNEWAYQNALDNVLLNNAADKIDVAEAEISIMAEQKFDIILANINKPIIIDNLQMFFNCLPPSGILVLSGILKSDADDVMNAAHNNSFSLISTRTKNDWICISLGIAI